VSEQHDAIIDAIAAGDPDSAAAAMAHHIHAAANRHPAADNT
jgi:DNA-binding FadR family transcriptional regulator